jgi:hypothetical protein
MNIMEVDLAHPLTDHQLKLNMTVVQLSAKVTERGGHSIDWVGLLTDIPGMQIRCYPMAMPYLRHLVFFRKPNPVWASREAMRLVGEIDNPRLVTNKTHQGHTEKPRKAIGTW